MKIDDFTVKEGATIIDAMQILDKSAKKVLFVLREGLLVAALTDGDIRRWILKRGSLKAEVRHVANYQPKFLYEKDKKNAKELMKEHMLQALPIVSEDLAVTTIVFWNEEEASILPALNMPVVIMAGGRGTRLYPYTKILPKPLIPIGELPIIEHIINRFYRAGCERFYLVVNHKKNMIKAYFNEVERGYTIQYIEEQMPLGTGGGLSLLKGVVDSTFILSNCDILIDDDYENIIKYHKKYNNLITMVCSMKNIKIPYGVIEVGETGEVESMKEKPELSFLTNTGVYVVEPKVLDGLVDNMAVGFPDIIGHYKAKGERIGVYPISEGSWMDMGQIEELEEMRRKLERHD